MINSTTHGMYYTATYKSWARMIQRCNNKKYDHYKYYGGRGINVCKLWLKFENFYKDMGERPEKMSIDRIDPEKGYFKENCKWSTHREQCNNKRNTIKICFNNEIKSLGEWAEIYKIKTNTLHGRLFNSGWNVEKALTTPTIIR